MKINFTEREIALRGTLSSLIRPSLSVLQLSKFIGVNERVIREFLKERDDGKQTSLSGKNYDKIVRYLSGIPFVLDFMNLPQLASSISRLSYDLKEQKIKKEALIYEYPMPSFTKQDDDVQQFIDFLFNNYKKVPKEFKNIASEVSEERKEKKDLTLGFCELIVKNSNECKSHEDFSNHSKLVRKFSEIYDRFTSKIYMYGFLKPTYLLKGRDEHEMYLFIATGANYNPDKKSYELLSDHEKRVSGIMTNEKGQVCISRRFLKKQDFLEKENFEADKS